MTGRHSERGQVLPLWIAAIVTTFVLMFLSLNYGNTLRWEMRAQNAADAAAQALMAIQTQHFNEMSAILYASNVEEFRTRSLLDGMLNALNGAGGCTGLPPSGPRASIRNPAYLPTGQTPFSTTGTNTCAQVFADLLPKYEESVTRYGKDIEELNNIATLTQYRYWTADSASLLTHISATNHCNNVSTSAATVSADGGDCQFTYHLNGIAPRRGLNSVDADAFNIWLPTLGLILPNETESENANLFDPGMVDVVVCTKVPPLIPLFGALQAQSHYVMGRAGATAVLAENDWLQPGAINDPARPGKVPFQPQESYSTVTSGAGYNWYGVLFGGTPWTVGTYTDPQQNHFPVYYTYATENEMDAYAGWWTSIPYDPRKVDTATPTTAVDCPA
jgi:hypothetical protein